VDQEVKTEIQSIALECGHTANKVVQEAVDTVALVMTKEIERLQRQVARLKKASSNES